MEIAKDNPAYSLNASLRCFNVHSPANINEQRLTDFQKGKQTFVLSLLKPRVNILTQTPPCVIDLYEHVFYSKKLNFMSQPIYNLMMQHLPVKISLNPLRLECQSWASFFLQACSDYIFRRQTSLPILEDCNDCSCISCGA